jgi:hypothetical protein
MVGAPEISDKGVQAKCLLNPQLRPNGAVWLNNNDIKIKVLQQSVSAPKQKAKGLVRLAPDGIYKAYKLRHEGDTRGGEWYTTADCIRIGDAIPSTSSGRPTPKINFLEGEDVG